MTETEYQTRATNGDFDNEEPHCGPTSLRRCYGATLGSSASRRFIILLAISVSIASNWLPAAANPIHLELWHPERAETNPNEPTSSPWSAGPANAPQNINLTARGIPVRKPGQRVIAYNQITKTSLSDSIAAPRTALQGLDIGSPNGLYALVWSDGNPRLAQWDAVARVARNRWSLLRQKLALSGCTSFANTWTSTGEIYVKCGTRVLLSVNVTTTAGVKARSVAIDNAGAVRYYGPKPAVGSAPLLLTITPTTANYTGNPVGNLKTWRWTSTTSKVSWPKNAVPCLCRRI